MHKNNDVYCSEPCQTGQDVGAESQPLQLAIDRLDFAQQNLNSNLGWLSDNLAPILAPPGPEKAVDPIMSPGGSQVTVRLNVIASRLEALSDFVLELRSRAEV